MFKSTQCLKPVDVDENGNTKLHNKILNGTNFEKIRQYINGLDKKLASKMARTLNNNGYLPVLLVEYSQLNKHEKYKLRNILIQLSISHRYKKLSQELDAEKLQKVINLYNVLPNTPLFKNLELAFTVLNRVRKERIESHTHPQANEYSLKKRSELKNEIDDMREAISEKVMMELDSFKDSIDAENFEINLRGEEILKHKKGNCGELSTLAWYFLKKIDKNTPAELWKIKNGDHGYLIIGDDSVNKVVCDPWLGKVYPFSAIEYKLKNYLCLKFKNSFVNICTFYNPKFQEAKPTKSQLLYTSQDNSDENPCCKIAYMGLGLFAAATVFSAATLVVLGSPSHKL